MLKQLANGDVAVERAAKQRFDRGGLKQLMAMGLVTELAVTQQLDMQRAEEPESLTAPILAAVARKVRCGPCGSLGQRVPSRAVGPS